MYGARESADMTFAHVFGWDRPRLSVPVAGSVLVVGVTSCGRKFFVRLSDRTGSVCTRSGVDMRSMT